MSSIFKSVVADIVKQNQPATDPAHLIRLGEAQALLASTMKGAWNSGTNYGVGQMATDAGSIYMATVANVNTRPSTNPGSWLLVLSGGANGTSSMVYVGWASDASGTGFSLTPSAGLGYAAFLVSTPNASPQASDFNGLWTNVRGPKGDTGDDGNDGTNGQSAYLYTAYASDANGANFSLTPGDSLNYVALRNSTTPIAAPQASDFAGLWKRYGATFTSVASPLTLGAAAAGQIGINASSGNVANYVVLRDGSGSFAANVIVSTQLVVGSATLSFSANALNVNQPVTATGLTLTDFSGVLKAAAGVVAGGATTSDLGEGTNLYFTNARVLTAPLTGLSSATVILATDTVLAAFGKMDAAVGTLQGQVNTSGAYTKPVTITPTVVSSGSPNIFTVTGAANTTLTASAESSDVILNLARTVQFATGALGTQRAVRIEAPSYGFVATSVITTATTLAISGPPIASSNATLTNAYALKIAAGTVNGSNTNAFGLFVDAPVGGANNYCAIFNSGFVGIGTAAPTSALDVNDYRIRIRSQHTPSSSSEAGQAGELFSDATYLYYRTASNVVKRIAWATF